MVLVPNEGLPRSAVDVRAAPESFAAKVGEKWKSFEKQLAVYNLEVRGIQRVEPDERHDLRTLGYSQIVLLWVSFNLAANNITLGMLGPAIFHLDFLDACLCAVFGMLVGCLAVAYIATFGPLSGNRTMILARSVP
jgi:hypothetical protein